MRLNPSLFLTLDEGGITLWDYRNQRRFEINLETLERLLAWSGGQPAGKTSFDAQLEARGLLEDSACGGNPQDAWGWDPISFIFHMGTQYLSGDGPVPSPEEFSDRLLKTLEDLDPEKLDLFPERTGEFVALPDPDLARLQDAGFLDVLARRRTCREFLHESVDLATLSTLLFATFGRFHASDSDDETSWRDESAGLSHYGFRRTSPSGGSLQPIEAYVVATRVRDLDPGAYYYSPREHALVAVRDDFAEDGMRELLAGQYFTEGMAFGVFLTARFDRVWWRYKISRAYRVVLLDAGHLSQTFHLTATALGLDSWLSGAFFDREVEDFLRLDTPREGVLFFVCAGIGTGSPFHSLHLQRAASRSTPVDSGGGQPAPPLWGEKPLKPGSDTE